EGSQDASFQAMARNQQQVAAVVREDSNVEMYMSFVGASGPRPTVNSGTLFLRLKDRKLRKLTADEVVQELRAKLSGFPGVKVYLQNPPSISVGGQLTKAQYQYTLQDADLNELYATAERFVGALRQVPGFLDVNTDMQISSPQLAVDINRDKATALGVTAQQIETALGLAFSSQQISTIYTSLDQYQVILELLPQYQDDPNSLSRLYIRSTNGSLVRLDAVAKITRGVGPLTINHLGQLPSVTVSFNLAPDTSLGAAVQRIQQLERQIKMPAGVSTSFQGTAQAFQSSLQGLGILLLMAVVVVYIVLGVLYESFIHPLTILSGLPSAAVGALITLMFFDVTLSLYAFVGVIMLIGIVKKNAIMMIDFALARQRGEGIGPAEAIVEAALIRFRPIMMTTMAALMGTLPIALGVGQGSEARRPLGLAVVGGLMLSQLLTLYLTPVIYVYLDRLQGARFILRRVRPARPPVAPAPAGKEAGGVQPFPARERKASEPRKAAR
ncbi:MAG TPA: efflux RND transporter permease subunit, partial [Steroidobacteraceae bacterium]|nr:efflux RND transporter permease subunit [Steroidobacteraceae bacterium]